jgi:hypothetical protein
MTETQLKIWEIHRAAAFHATARASERSKDTGLAWVIISEYQYAKKIKKFSVKQDDLISVER